MPNHRTPGTGFLTVALSLLGAGCFAHAPVAPTESLTNQQVRLHLSQPGRERLFGVLDRSGRYLDGRVLQQGADSVLVEISIPRSEGFEQDGALVQRVPLAREEIIALEVRRLDRARTAMLLAAIGAAAAALVIRTFSGEAGGGAYPPMDNGQTESVVPGLDAPLPGLVPAPSNRPCSC